MNLAGLKLLCDADNESTDEVERRKQEARIRKPEVEDAEERTFSKTGCQKLTDWSLPLLEGCSQEFKL